MDPKSSFSVYMTKEKSCYAIRCQTLEGDFRMWEAEENWIEHFKKVSPSLTQERIKIFEALFNSLIFFSERANCCQRFF